MKHMLAIVLAFGPLLRLARAQPAAVAMQVPGSAPTSAFDDDLGEVRRKILSQRLVMHLVMLYQKTMQNVAKGNYLGAKNDIDAVMGEQGVAPEDRIEMIGERGMMEAAAGDIASAGPDLDIGIKALEGKALDSDETILLKNLRMLKGKVLSQQGRLQEALREEDRAVALDPKYAMPHFFRGLFLLKLGRSNEAVRSYERAVALDPAAVKKMNACDEFRAVGQVPPSCGV